MLIYIQAIIVVVTSGMLIILAREKPPTPPSLSANRVVPPLQFNNEMISLFKNRNYMLLTLNACCLYANTSTLSAIVSALTKPYGFKGTDNALFAVVFIVTGLVGTVFAGIMLDKYRKYKISIILIAIVAMIAYGLTYLTLPTGVAGYFAANLGLVGFGTLPVIPVCFAFAVELTYPIQEAMSNGMMVLPSKIYASLMGIAGGKLCEYSPKYALILFAANAVISFVASLFVKEDLRRLSLKRQSK